MHRRRLAADRVLNAFRHQRKEHRADCEAPVTAGVCSTPFGINGRNTAIGLRPRQFAGCSTPFGINGRNT